MVTFRKMPEAAEHREGDVHCNVALQGSSLKDAAT